jgi:hypothetical protein
MLNKHAQTFDLRNSRARSFNLFLGGWLFLSAFLWPHSPAQFTNTWLSGLIVALVAAIALKQTVISYVNTLVGTWVLMSSFIFRTSSSATRWHDFAVGVLIIIASLIPAPASAGGSRFRSA